MTDFFGTPFDPCRFQELANFVFFPKVDSTNAVGRGLIDHLLREEVDLAPTVIAAASQTDGRGRRDRVWQSPEGGLYATFVFRVPEGTRMTQIPLAAALWVADAASRAIGVDARLKWPNDVLCRGRKLAGILTEAKTRGEDTHVAIGIGVNVLGSAEGLGQGTTTLARESPETPSLVLFFDELCGACDRYLAAPSGARVVDGWLSRSCHAPGDEIRVTLDENGAERSVVGEFAGLTEDGLLRLRTGGSEIVIMSGEVQPW